MNVNKGSFIVKFEFCVADNMFTGRERLIRSSTQFQGKLADERLGINRARRVVRLRLVHT